MSVAEKPGVLERLGSALNSSDLAPREGKMGAVELIGALAFTQTNPDAAEHVEMDAAVIDPRTELASVLVRLKYGGDRVLGERAVTLLCGWVRHQKAFGRWKERKAGDLVEVFARQALAEWLFPVCGECSGREFLGLEKGATEERRVRCTRCRGVGLVEVTTKSRWTVKRDCTGCAGRGWRTYTRVSKTKTQQCTSCNGTGRRRADDAGRARVLRLEQRVYQRHWLKRFDWLSAGLDRLDRLQRLCLQSQMRSGIKAA